MASLEAASLPVAVSELLGLNYLLSLLGMSGLVAGPGAVVVDGREEAE